MKTKKPTAILCLAFSLLCVAAKTSEGKDSGRQDGKPNVLFIAIDDLNDWTGTLMGNPQAKTPHMDKLASQGMVFANAHCAAPACGPSRSAIGRSQTPLASPPRQKGWPSPSLQLDSPCGRVKETIVLKRLRNCTTSAGEVTAENTTISFQSGVIQLKLNS